MTTDPITESGMAFGPYPEGSFFYIEKSTMYQRVQDSVPIAEFLLLRHSKKGPVIWVVEAKTSSPHSKNETDFDKYIASVSQKLINALSLGLAACLKRHQAAYAELPQKFQKLDLAVLDFRLVLVVKKCKTEWIPPLKEALDKSLRATVKTWALSPTAVVVFNEELAQEKQLVIGAPALENEK